ncbi:MAG: HDIG domain-containing protein [Thermodesulfovibrionia bacterium]
MKSLNPAGVRNKNGRQKVEKKGLLSKDTLKRVSLLIAFSSILNLIILKIPYSIEEVIGTFLLISLLLIILYKDVLRYKPSIKDNYNTLLLLGILLIGNFVIGMAFLYVFEGFVRWLGKIGPDVVIYAIPLATGSMLAALLIDIHTAIVFTVITSLISGLWLNNPVYSLFIFALGITSAFSVIRCKRRSAIWRAGIFVSLVAVAMSIIMLLLKGVLFRLETGIVIMVAFSNGIVVAMLVSAILPLLEYLFKITTDISLLELLDLDHPLMRQLLLEAPGTYHHSIVVGNLVESAAEAVGVNPLLARVGAYYHDIGKIKMPEYFIENQVVPVSKHDALTPHMSSLILISHVKEGVELAKQHKLPKEIIDIIQQHHGTSIQTYFYEKAKELHEKDPTVPIFEDDFRYPGPKPKSRVAALILMADAVEAASRVLTDPTPSRVSALVERIINHCFIDGQLDECELTLKDIREIKIYFVYLLTSMYHKRIDYPGFEIRDEDTHKEPAKAKTS